MHHLHNEARGNDAHLHTNSLFLNQFMLRHVIGAEMQNSDLERSREH